MCLVVQRGVVKSQPWFMNTIAAVQRKEDDESFKITVMPRVNVTDTSRGVTFAYSSPRGSSLPAEEDCKKGQPPASSTDSTAEGGPPAEVDVEPPAKAQRVSKKEPPAKCQSKEPPAKGQSKKAELSFGFMGVVTPTPSSSLALQVASVNVTEEADKATVL